MKFEHVLQIYWTKGFFFGSKPFPFEQTFLDIFNYTPGIGKKFKFFLKKRFELTYFRRFFKRETVYFYQNFYKKQITTPLNIILSQIHSVNNFFWDLKKLNIIRYYLIKTYRGKCHFLGKPVRGQRTWSNAWNSFKLNKTLRIFVLKTRLQLEKNKKIEKINYKLIKKRHSTAQKSKTKTTKLKQKKTLWF